MAGREDRISRLSSEQRGRLVRELARRGRRGAATLPRGDDGAPRALSFAQQRLWFLDRLDPGSTAYLVPAALRLEGRLDPAVLERALSEIVRRHHVLRTAFVEVDGVAQARVAAAAPVAIAQDDLRSLREAEREAEVRRQALAEAARPFDLGAPPLLRARLLRLSDAEHVLLLTLHHIACDAWSSGVLLRELAALHPALACGAPSPLPELAIQYADFADWQRAALAAGGGEVDLAYWRRRLAGAVPALDLCADRPRPSARSGRGAHHAFSLPAERWRPFAELARAEQATPYMALLAALDAFLFRATGQEDLLVGTPVAGRERAETDGLIGFFVNTVVLRTDLSGDPSFRELLRRARETALQAFAHQALPFDLVVDAVRPRREGGSNPLFQVMLDLETAGPARLALPGLVVTRLDLERGTSKLDLLLSCREADGGLEGSLEYDTDLFDEATAARFTRQLGLLVEAAVGAPDRPVSALPILSEAERRRVVVAWNDTACRFPHEKGIHQLFQAQAARTPEALAVEGADRSFTYRELDARASRIARHLRRLGFGRGRLAGLLALRVPDTIAALLGVLEAGGAWVPLDPAAPRRRLAETIADAELGVVLAAGPLPDGFAPPPGVEVVRLDDPSRAARVGAEPARHLQPIAGSEDTAYVIYTSGSTGKPKGVRISHRSAVNLWAGLARTAYAGRAGPLRVNLNAPLVFDASVQQLLALLAGHALVLVPAEVRADAAAMVEFLRARRVDVLDCVPSHLKALLAAGLLDPAHPRPRLILVGGEPLDLATWRTLAAAEGIDSWNVYGPTECAVDATACRVGAAPGGPSIGRPLANVRAYVLDAHGAPLPPGLPGELCLGGEGVGQGYLGRPALTAERFVEDPFAPGGRMYRTGDRARWREDGQLELLGRLDAQVKVRGHRIELGEIEAALVQHPAVAAAAAAVQLGPDGERALVAYVVGRGSPAPGAAPLRQHLRERLPESMVPAAFVALQALPHTPSGKLDRRALPAPRWEAAPGPGDDRPATPLEELVRGAFAEVLGVERVGLEDGFFELGGHSLLATRLTARVRALAGVELPLRALFEHPTPAALARLVDERRRGDAGGAPIAPRPDPSLRPLSSAQERMWFLDQLEPGSALYHIAAAVRLRGALDPAALGRALSEVVRRHEVLRTRLGAERGRPVAILDPPAPVPLEETDLTQLPADERERAARALATAEARRPLDPARGPLLRARLLRLGEAERWLVLVVHHAVSDGASTGVLVREVTALYASEVGGGGAALAALPLQYADFAAWQATSLARGEREAQLAWWRERLAGAPGALELPFDRPRRALASAAGERRPLALPAPLSRGLALLARREGATLFMAVVAALDALLARVTGETDLCVGTPVSGRDRAELEGLVGLFVNTLVLRVDLAGDPSFRELLRRVREATLDAHAHAAVPFDEVVDAVQPARSLTHTPLFQVMASVEDEPGAPRLPGVEACFLPLDTGTAKFDLTLELRRGGEGLAGDLEYRRDLFDPATVDRLAASFERLLAAAVEDPDLRLSELPLQGPEERQRVLALGQGEPAGEVGELVPAKLAALAARGQDAPAIFAAGEVWSRGALDRRARQIAHRLRAAGVTAGARVGHLLQRTPDAIAALLGIWRVGAVHLPLDPQSPPARTAALLADAGATHALTTSALAPALAGAATPPVLLDGVEGEPADGAAAPLDPAAAAYVIYTSGSTGRPKGVVVSHRALAEHCRSSCGHYRFAPGDRALQFAAFSFDASLEQILAPLSGGAALVLRGDELQEPRAFAEAIARDGVTFMDLPPAYLDGLVRSWEADPGRAAWPACPALRLLMVSADVVRPETLALCRRSPWGRAGLVNNYGPTEATISCADYDVPADVGDLVARGRVPIGRPLPGRRAYVLDARGEPVPVGVPGELHLGGEGLADGYLGRPELTAERFLPDPFDGEPGARMYRTGDRARWLAGGELELLGRVDEQVKLRGFRLELGEVEAALRACPGVRAAAAAVKEEGATRRLVGYVVPADGAAPAAEALAERLGQVLPPYMVPSAFVAIAALPLTAGGKVNRRALPPPPAAAEAGYLAPRTAAEERLAAIWAEVLGAKRVGVHDDFFALGGDSILSIQIVARAREAGLVLTPRQVFETPTVAGLAAAAGTAAVAVAEQGPVAGPVALAPIQRWFLERAPQEPHHFNQSLLLEVLVPLAREPLAAALRDVAWHHDALRLRFEQTGEGWQQCCAPPGEHDAPLAWEDLSTLAGEAVGPALERRCAGLQRALDLGAGPLVRAAYFDLGRARPGRLLLVAHHLAVDGVSWRILLEDLERAYAARAAGEAPRLPPKSSAYREWTAALTRFAASQELGDELAYWEGLPPGAPLPVAPLTGDDLEQDEQAVEVELPAPATRALLTDAAAALHAEPNDLLLAALFPALARWTASPVVRIDLEGHGREELPEPLDLSRTVGWFTSVFPVAVDLRGAADAREALGPVKEAQRRVPRRGVGYGVLRHLAPDPAVRARLAAAEPGQVSFNYLGQLDLALAGGRFRPAAEDRGPERSPRQRRSHLLGVDAAVVGGRLRARFAFGRAVPRDAVQAVAAWFEEGLRLLAGAAAEAGAADRYAPAEFPEAGLSPRELAALLREVGGA
ncbi:non-ribosomal peptide synthetase [Anaeromyxobacter diazotrophicus]|uniref:non-ribosomal peptide synthetase n=1 Tax=Anaeromyxobacter diazotrophicus TaxID=2590199 RepID=UPI001591065F|nr:non-ribosomal peptide synthetase [Anaeromyxobacter diazotrophicus]